VCVLSVVVAGEIGSELFIVDKGEIEILDEITSAPLIRLGEGSFFGEIALLTDSAKRTKTARACTLCELFSLSKVCCLFSPACLVMSFCLQVHFDKVIASYPAFRANCLKVARARVARRQISNGKHRSRSFANIDHKQALKNFNKRVRKSIREKVTPTEEEEPKEVLQIVEGAQVRIIKKGRQYRRSALVLDPDWSGRVKVQLVDGWKQIKSYKPDEIEVIQNAFEVGDIVEILKNGAQKGKTATVIHRNWGGRIKVQMDEDHSIKSYLMDELSIPEIDRTVDHTADSMVDRTIDLIHSTNISLPQKEVDQVSTSTRSHLPF
jgi:hypothetical protein